MISRRSAAASGLALFVFAALAGCSASSKPPPDNRPTPVHNPFTNVDDPSAILNPDGTVNYDPPSFNPPAPWPRTLLKEPLLILFAPRPEYLPGIGRGLSAAFTPKSEIYAGFHVTLPTRHKDVFMRFEKVKVRFSGYAFPIELKTEKLFSENPVSSGIIGGEAYDPLKVEVLRIEGVTPGGLRERLYPK